MKANSMYQQICERSSFAVVVVLTLVFALSGCADIQIRMGQNIDPRNIESELRFNESTQNDVKAVFGEPDGMGVYVSPITGKASTMWSYYFAEGGLEEIHDTNLYVYFDGDVYEGYLWFSNVLRKP